MASINANDDEAFPICLKPLHAAATLHFTPLLSLLLLLEGIRRACSIIDVPNHHDFITTTPLPYLILSEPFIYPSQFNPLFIFCQIFVNLNFVIVSRTAAAALV